MAIHIRRREFIFTLGGAAAAWPLAARATSRTGAAHRRAPPAAADDPVFQARLGAFQQALAGLGWSEGRNVRFEYRWSGGDMGRIRGYAAELAGLALDVILANGTPVIGALKQATRTTPLVFVVVNDPVAEGFVRAWRTRARTSPVSASWTIRWWGKA